MTELRIFATGDGSEPASWLSTIIFSLAFSIGDYFQRTGAAVTDPPFLDVVTLDFAVADATQHYHVPLLVSPFGYSTYRGS